MIASLFAVAMLGGGEVPILHATQFADAHALAHAQMDHVALHDHAHDAGTDSTDAGSRSSAKSSRPRPRLHPRARPLLRRGGDIDAGDHSAGHRRVGVLHRQLNAALPYGQLSNPPLRPPRPLA